MGRKHKMPNKIAIELMKDIKDGKLKTKAICEKYKDYDVRPHDIYNIVHKDHYSHLSDYV